MNRLLAVPLVLLIVALIVIGTLQYRWLGRVAEAERQQMRRNLEFAVESLERDVTDRIHTVFRAFLGPEDQDVRWLLEEWESNPDRTNLVAAIYVADREGDAWTVRHLDLITHELVASPLPPEIEPMRRALDEVGPRGPNERWPSPMFGAIPALFIVQLPPNPEGPPPGKPARIIFVQLDRDAIGALVSASAQRVAPDLDVELRAADALVYRTPDAQQRRPDIRHDFRPLTRREGPRPRPRGHEAPPPNHQEMWELALSHRGGGLDAIVATAHRRNLAVASLVLLILVAASALLIALLRRGERLRKQQSEFVAAMSHELNTPLAILRVASENLHDGIVHDPEKVSRYVRTIARETAHLSEMVNHVLELAGMRASVTAAEREVVDVSAMIDEAVAQSRWMTDGSDIALSVDAESDLHVVGDERALTRAVQNLVANAIRHAGAGKWVGVHASRDNGYIRIVVEDRGPGIDAAEAGHLFEPFYRGRNSRNVRGTGLGLTIVKQIIDSHGGTVNVERGRAAGAAFIVRLPAEGES